MKYVIIITSLLLVNYNAYALCPLGDVLLKNNKENEAAAVYMGCADGGDIKSQYLVGSYFYLGKGVNKSFASAYTFYNTAAEGGYAPAQVKLALLYWRGEGVKQDLVKALKWMILANDASANKWFYPAVDQGLGPENQDKNVEGYIKQISALMNVEQRAEAVNMASEAKFSLLDRKAREVLDDVAYAHFLKNIKDNRNDKAKLEAIIKDLQKAALNKRK